MLYKLTDLENEKKKLSPMPFFDLADLQKLEKDLENLLADNLLNTLFEEETLMPIFQERQYKSEADLYALNQHGDLVIFELKRGVAGSDAMHQILGYAQKAGKWTYGQLEKKYKQYSKSNSDLQLAHQEAFQLEIALLPTQFNNEQHLLVVGNAANTSLMKSIDYWKQKGLSVDFLPYRIYDINGDSYFEFFSLPYDKHQNPASIKGVLFDTNKSYNSNSIWDMFEKSRVAAYGETQYVIDYLKPNDIVFYSHKGTGIVGAAKVISGVKQDGSEEKYCDVEFLTPIPNRNTGVLKKMSFKKVSQVTGKSFFWARTIKVPYLSQEESSLLIEELKTNLK